MIFGKYMKFLTIIAILLALVFFYASKHNIFQRAGKGEAKYTHTRRVGNMLIGGMMSDRDKIDSFANDIMEDDAFNKHWSLLEKSNELRKAGDYNGAIKARIEALEYAQGIGQKFQTKIGLARLYRMNGQYDLAIKEYEWCINYSNRPDVIEKLTAEIDEIKQR
jgi:tetratricopeptide (TPR) repeat protein